MIRIRSGDDRVFYASKDTLKVCPYFDSLLSRWSKEDEIVLEANSESLSIILELLKYGKDACSKKISKRLKEKILKDADYLGVPKELLSQLERSVSDAIRKKFALEDCSKCKNREVLVTYRFYMCKTATMAKRYLSVDGSYSYYTRVCFGYCKRCETYEPVQTIKTCLLCKGKTKVLKTL